MSLLSDKKTRRKRDVVNPAVKYVDKERENDKAVDLSTLPEITSKKPISKFTEFFSMTTMSKQVASELWAEKVAQQLVQWAEEQKKPSAFKMNEFYRLLGMPRTTFIDLEKNYPILEKARLYAVSILGDKREAGLIWKQLEPSSTINMMPNYDDDWRAMVEWRSSLKQKEGSSGSTTNQYVVLEKIPNSGLVPPLNSSLVKERDNENRPEEDGADNSRNDDVGQGNKKST